ncbi:Uncharacterised protein [uncultured archaeon]|nr:Uncharacterised protein [uncultured archaeon]
MSLEIQVVSEAKGSNHGGRCIVKEPGDRLPRPFYIKHCSSSRIHKGESSFMYIHQPIYEAVTCEMALRLGLETPNFYVLLNPKNDVTFIATGEQKCDIRAKQPFYFASELLIPPQNEDLTRAHELMIEDEFYRDMLMISDIVDRKNNYFYDEHSDSIIYLDLGCNFVDAHQNFIELKHHHKAPLEKKELKKAMKLFQKYSIITKSRRGNIGLIDFINLPRELDLLTLNPRERVRLDSLISEEEIDEIIGRIASGLYYGKQLKRNGDNPHLVRN